MRIVTNNSSQLDVNRSTVSKNGILKIGLWFLGVMLVPQVNAMILLFIYYVSIQGGAPNATHFGDWYNTISIVMIGTLLASIFTIPLLFRATPGNHFVQRLKYWGIKRVQANVLVKWTVFAALLFSLLQVVGLVLGIPDEPFILTLKTQVNSTSLMITLFVSAGILAPVLEEIIYRGWLYQRLVDEKIDAKKVVVLTSLIFALVHSQYEHSFTFFTIFSFGLLFGYIRYKSQNIAYCILIHMLYNVTLLVYTLFFMA